MPISFLRQLVQLRIRNRALSFPLYFFWIVVSGIALITLPALLRMGVLFWDLSLPQLIPIYVVGAAYLMYSLIPFYA